MTTTTLDHNAGTATAIRHINAALANGDSHLDLSRLEFHRLPAEIAVLAGQLTSLSLEMCGALTSLEGIETLTALTSLNVSCCLALTSLDGVEKLTALTSLDLSFCDALICLDGIELLTALRSLDLYGCYALTSLDGIELLTALIWLDVKKCRALTNLDCIKNLTALASLYVGMNDALTSLNSIEKLIGLTSLDVSYCDALTSLEGINQLTALTTLKVSGCNALTSLDGIAQLTALTSLNVSGCEALTSLDGIEQLAALTSLKVSGCKALTSLDGINQLTALTSLNMSWCDALTSLDGIYKLTALTSLDVSGCEALTSLHGIEQLAELATLYAEDCTIDDIKPLKVLLSTQTTLQEVYLAGNPLQQRFNLQLVENEDSLPAIKSFFYQQGTVPVIVRLPAKVLLLGNHAVGKSTLVTMLDSKARYAGSTHLLQVHSLGTIQQSAAELADLQLPAAVLYDFGGQDYYHGVYRVFMGQHGVTCLLWKAVADCNRYSADSGGLPTLDFNRTYWLGCLQHHQQQTHRHTISADDGQAAAAELVYQNPLLLLQTHVEDGDYRQTSGAQAGRQHYFSLPVLTANADNKRSNANTDDMKKLPPLDLAAFTYFKAQLDDCIAQQQIEIEQSVWYAEFLQFILQQHQQHDFITTATDELLAKYKAPGDPLPTHQQLQDGLTQLHRQGLVLYYPDVVATKVWLNPVAFAKYVHETVLGKERLIKHLGKIPQREFEQGIDTDILQILQHEKVVFLHRYGGNDGKTTEYIVPNYLPLTDSNCAEYQLYTFALATQPALCLWFEHYLPLGLINQLVCYFGNLPDHKKFWRDQILFTLDKQGQSGGSLVLIQLVFAEKLQLKIYLQNNNPEQKQRHLGYLYYVLMAMYHKAASIEAYEEYQRSIYSFKKTGWVDVSWQVPAARLVHNDIDLSVLYNAIYTKPPKDLRLSIDGEHYVKATQLADLKQQTMVSAVRPDDENQQPVPVEAHLFAPFMLQKPKKRLKVFISYAHKDTIFREQLQKFFSNMLRANQIEIWHDNKIYAGEPWDQTIKQKLAEADVAVVLTSQDLLASDYIQQTEMPLMIKLHQERGLTILPVLLKDCCFDSWQVAAEQMARNGDAKAAPFDVSTLQFLPKDDNEQLKPVVEWQPFEEKAWKRVVQALQKLIDAQ